MAETLETIGTKLDALGAKLDVFSTSVDKRFEQVDKPFEQVDKRFDELKSELATRIEAVDAKVDLVVEGFGNLLKKDASNSASHARFEARVDNHELRLVALERERQK
jgi:chaperonin cofactor prefoldin